MAGYSHGCGSGSRKAQNVSRVSTQPSRNQKSGRGEAAASEVHVVGATIRVAYQMPIITLIAVTLMPREVRNNDQYGVNAPSAA
ncbi:hypothetical protein D3C72_1855950 [compost metagenome]